VSYRGSEKLILDNMITVPMKAGQAFILNHAVIHASTLNNSNKERLVIAYGITSNDAPLSFYFSEKDTNSNRVECFKMPDDFFIRYNNIGERPCIGKKVSEFAYDVPAISSEKIGAMIRQERKKRVDIPYYKKYWIEGAVNQSSTLKERNPFSILSSKLKKLIFAR
jgi:hypothetical protein